MPNTNNAHSVKRTNAQETQDVSVRLRIILFFIQNNKSSVDGKQSIDNILRDLSKKINDNISDDYVLLDDEYIYIDPTSKNDYEQKSEVLNNLITKTCSQYKSVVIHIYIPTDNEFPIPSGIFFNKYRPRFLSKDFKYNNIEKAKSFIAYAHYTKSDKKVINQEKDIDDIPETDIDDVPDDLEAKVCAILCHYAYFYLDWLELNRKGACGFENKPIDKNDIIDVLLYDEGKGMFGSQTTKAKYRIINRINEILKIVNSEAEKDTSQYLQSAIRKNSNQICDNELGIVELEVVEKPQIIIPNYKKVDPLYYRNGEFKSLKQEDSNKVEIIYEILKCCSDKGMPVDFYSLYESCGYWKYLENKEQAEGSSIAQEAKKWHVLHPYKMFKKEIRDNRVLFKCNNEDNKTGLFSEYYTGLLETGMGNVSGYGGILFFKKEIENQVPTFVYCTKGTDFNSINDWVFTNLMQGLSGFSLQHLHTILNAEKIDKEIRKKYKSSRLIFTGHSLGGGLASSSTIVSPGRHGITFNAAGLNFIGVLGTRLTGTVTNGNWSLLHSTSVTKRVHPIRIKGEAVDALMVGSKIILLGLNERGYGSYPFEIDLNTPENIGWRHGINQFLNFSIIKQVRIVSKPIQIQTIREITCANVSEDYKFISDPYISFEEFVR